MNSWKWSERKGAEGVEGVGEGGIERKAMEVKRGERIVGRG